MQKLKRSFEVCYLNSGLNHIGRWCYILFHKNQFIRLDPGWLCFFLRGKKFARGPDKVQAIVKRIYEPKRARICFEQNGFMSEETRESQSPDDQTRLLRHTVNVKRQLKALKKGKNFVIIVCIQDFPFALRGKYLPTQ